MKITSCTSKKVVSNLSSQKHAPQRFTICVFVEKIEPIEYSWGISHNTLGGLPFVEERMWKKSFPALVAMYLEEGFHPSKFASLAVSTHLKNISSQNGNLPQIGMKINNI